MVRTLSTYLFVKRRLTPALLTEIARHGITGVEIFCARAHFNYQSPDVVREIAGTLRDNNLRLHALHAPAERDFNPMHESSAPLSICDPERVRRLEAVDEIKRALDVAEYLPFRYLVQHMGSSRDAADGHRFEAAFSSLEHLHIFAKARGVTLALENTPGELATPAHLRQFIIDTRLTDLRLCFDIGHAHIGDGVLASLEPMREFLVTSHIHDNHGLKDEHLLPYEGTIEWKSALPALPPGLPLVFELKEQPAYADPAPTSVALSAARAAFDRIERALSSPEAESQN
ncbi:MAG: sugar phosphate isomerase/epimerase [Acidobacteria bacterium]|nr:MAG: sugar phosphate isomerase/epimerase [Acidobacteriota bacterium]